MRRDDRNAFRVETDFGAFAIDRVNKFFRRESSAPNEPIPLEWIERFDFSFETRQPVWEEDAYMPWFSNDYTRAHDLHHWYVISLVLVEGEPIQLYEIGEYRPSHRGATALDRWSEKLKRRLLGPGAPTIEDRARQTLKALQDAFAASGHTITLTPDWVKKKEAATAARKAETRASAPD